MYILLTIDGTNIEHIQVVNEIPLELKDCEGAIGFTMLGFHSVGNKIIIDTDRIDLLATMEQAYIDALLFGGNTIVPILPSKK